MPGFFAELETTTRRQPGSPAFASPSGIFSYETFSRVIDNVADNASANGLAPGELVHIKSADSGLRYLLVLGFLKAGLTVSVTSRPSAFAEHGIVVDALVEEPSDSGASRINVRKRLTFSPSWLQPVKDGRTARQADLDYALVIGSSGSTGKTKLIRVSRASLEREIARNFDDPHYEGELRHLSTSGDTSLLTLKDYASVLMKGGLIIQTDARSGAAVLDASDLYRPSYVSMAPSTLVDLLTTLARTPRRTRKVAYLRLSGAYCTLATREKALCQFAEHVLTSYGATEIGRVALGDFEEIKGTEGSVGRIRDGVTVETVDENGQPLPAGSEGELRIKPPAGVAATYLGPDGDVDVLRDGWFYPGDIGCVDLSTGQLIFTGRKSTVINIGGTKISPEIVEGTLLEMPEIEDVAVAPMASEHGYQLICALVVDGGRLTLDDVTTFLLGRKRRFPVSALRSVASIPRTDNGKIDRPAVRAMAEGG